MVCQNIKCQKEHNGSFGSGKFCSRACANSRVHSNNTKEKIVCGLTNYWDKKERVLTLYNYTCESCGNNFTQQKIKTGYSIKCTNCRKKRILKNEVTNILEYSNRTVQKILKRANICCAMCSWDLGTLDIHHIKPKAKGGTDEHTNLICLCPNCHRLAHSGFYKSEQLFEYSMDKMFKDWKIYYNVNVGGYKLTNDTYSGE